MAVLLDKPKHLHGIRRDSCQLRAEAPWHPVHRLDPAAGLPEVRIQLSQTLELSASLPVRAIQSRHKFQPPSPQSSFRTSMLNGIRSANFSHVCVCGCVCVCVSVCVCLCVCVCAKCAFCSELDRVMEAKARALHGLQCASSTIS